MKIKDLQPRQGKVEVVAKLIDKKEPRDIASANFTGRVCDARLQDETGTIRFSLWNEQVEQVNNGDTVKITNGYVSEYQGEMQLSTGRFGKLVVVEVVDKEPEQKKEEIPDVKKNFDEADFEESTEDDLVGFNSEEESI